MGYFYVQHATMRFFMKFININKIYKSRKGEFMGRPFYADYVNHCLKKYVVNYDKKLIEDVEIENWEAVNNAYMKLSIKDRELIDEIYGRFGTISENIKEINEEMKVNEKYMWALVARVTKDIAKERGLI